MHPPTTVRTAPAAARPWSAAALAARTPASRDRYVDLLRALSMGVVVLGHWLLAVVVVRDGALAGDNLLALQPATQWLTWVLQVMPVFFLVGGYANAASLSSPRAPAAADWVAGRTRRLLRPTLAMVATWTAAVPLLALAGIDAGPLALGAALVAVPLWFLAVYALVVALAPAMVALQRRHGARVVVALVAGAAAVDAVAALPGLAGVGWLNFALVWLAVHQLGVCWHDGLLAHRRTAWALALGGLAGLVLLTQVGPYPLSMVGVPGAVRTNNTPPTVALLALAAWQAGLLLLVAAPVRRWLRKPGPWRAVVAANGMAMTVYLWHMTALVVVAAVLVPRWEQAPAGSAAWWLQRPLWLAALVLALAPLVAAFSRVERAALLPPSVAPRADRAAGGPGAALRAGLGAAAMAGGMATLALRGFSRPALPGGVPWDALALLAAAAVLLALRPAGGRRRVAPVRERRPVAGRP